MPLRGPRGNQVRVFVSGVSSGIGMELARQLIGAGHEVWGIARREAKLQALASELDSPSFYYSSCDTADEAACAQVYGQMQERGFLPDIVVLNAAIDLEEEKPALDFAQTARMMRTNVDGAFYWVTAFIKPFLQRGHGQFIGVSSLFAHWPDGASVGYSASKSALSMLLRGLRIRYAGTGLHFKLLYLGPVDTPINPRFEQEEPSSSFLVASAPDTARYITGMMTSSRQNFYFPLYIFLIFTFLRWLPDRVFESLTSPFKR